MAYLAPPVRSWGFSTGPRMPALPGTRLTRAESGWYSRPTEVGPPEASYAAKEDPMEARLQPGVRKPTVFSSLEGPYARSSA